MKTLILSLIASIAVANTAVRYTNQYDSHTAPAPRVDGSTIYSIATTDDTEASAIQTAAAAVALGWCVYARNETTVNVACSQSGSQGFARWLIVNDYVLSQAQ